MTEGHTLFVLWFDPSRRAIVPVARLVHRREAPGDVYEFRYIRGASEAQAHGFLPFLAFPELHRAYLSRALFPFFANRVMPSTRPDYLEYVETLGLSRAEADSMSILARSGGKRETDRIEIVAMPARDEQTGAYTTYFLARGVQYFPGAEARIARLARGEQLFCMIDVQNPVNPDAVALRTGDNQLVGFVPDYLVTDVAKLVDKKELLRVFVERANVAPVPVHHRLLCRLEAEWPEGFVPFEGERFQPIGEEAGLAQSALAPERTSSV